VVVMDMGIAKAAQAWLNRFRAGGGSGYSAWRSCTLLQQMRGKKALHRLCLEVQNLGVQGLHAFVSKDRCNLPAPLLCTCEGGLRAGGPSLSVPCVEAPAARHTAGFRLQEGLALLGACWLVRPAGYV